MEPQEPRDNFYKKIGIFLSFLRRRPFPLIAGSVVIVLVLGFLWFLLWGGNFLFKNDGVGTSVENTVPNKDFSEKEKRDILKSLTDGSSAEEISIEEKRGILKKAGGSQDGPKNISDEDKARILKNL